MTTENKIAFTNDQIQWLANMGSDMYIQGISKTIEDLQKICNQILVSLPMNKQKIMDELTNALKDMPLPVITPNENKDVTLNEGENV